MSADSVLSAGAHSSESDADASDTCQTPNCWKDAHIVRVADETEVPAVLCDEHARLFLGVSS